jgi:para-nitrobenzyl esterase
LSRSLIPFAVPDRAGLAFAAQKAGEDHMTGTLELNRRHLLGAGTAMLAAAATAQAASEKPPTPSPPMAAPASALFPIAETRYGKVRGLDVGGIKQFKGIPYGASTEGRNRFMPPRKPAPWAGIHDCYGH